MLEALKALFGYLGAYSIKKRNILIFNVISVLFSILIFLYIGKIAAIFPVVATGIRYFVFIFRDKYKTKLPLYFCLALHIIALLFSVNAIITTETSTPIDIVPSVLVIAGCLIYWYCDKAKLKSNLFILDLLWIAYYLYCGLYLVCLVTTIDTTLIGVAYLRIKFKEKKLKNKKAPKKR